MKTIDGEESASFRKACRERRLLINNMERNNTLRKGDRSNYDPLTELCPATVVHCVSSQPRKIYKEKLGIFCRTSVMREEEIFFSTSVQPKSRILRSTTARRVLVWNE